MKTQQQIAALVKIEKELIMENNDKAAIPIREAINILNMGHPKVCAVLDKTAQAYQEFVIDKGAIK